MEKLVILLLVVISVNMAQPTIDGNIVESEYSLLGSANGRNGFGDDNDLGVLKYYANGTDLFIGITGEVNSNNNIVVFFDFSGYTGRGSSTLAGSSTSSVGVFTTSGGGLDGAILDLDVDFALAFNEGQGSTNFYLDYARFGSSTAGYLNTGVLGSSNQSGTNVSLDLGTAFGGTGNITYAYQNDFGSNSNHGLEMKIPIAAFAGVTNAHTVKIFVLITNNNGYISNECIPGDPGGSNLGDDANFSTISGVDFFTTNQALPVELTSFAARASGKNIVLHWNTATETDNAGFDVERKSLYGDDRGWTSVGFVAGNGTSATPNDYSFTDVHVAGGRYAYRLKQIDHDGRFEYSSIVEAVVAMSAGDYSLSQNYPNPFNPVTRFTFAVRQRQHALVTVYNQLGQEVAVLFNGIAEPDVRQSVTFDASGLSSGIYYYILKTGGHSESRKLLLMK